MPGKNPFKLDVVSVRLVKDARCFLDIKSRHQRKQLMWQGN